LKISLKQKQKDYQSHRKWVEKNREKFLAYHREYSARESTKKRRRELYRKRIEHYKQRDREHYYKTKERHRELQMAKKYGISVERYREMFDQQNNLCAICGEKESTKNKVLSVDHDHKTGKVRSLLCGKCNKALGFIQDNLEVIIKIQDYLNKYA